MEQKQTAPNLPPIGAAADPAFIPGLTLPGPGEGGDSAPRTEPESGSEAEPATATEPETGKPAGAAGREPEPEPAPGEASQDPEDPEAPEDAPPAKASGGSERTKGPEGSEASENSPAGPDDPGAPDAPDAPDDPASEATETADRAAADAEFTASDRRGTIAVDRDGVRFTLDDQAAEWRWDEIGAVEYGTSRWGKRLTVTVHTPEKRWYPTDVQAPDKATLERWTQELDAALDAWFEEE
ncbi:hypothetical protein [Streptomyces sp. NPDC007088]|uniref:hypothetical protein n=1 Tax=Streptomyces sp. NPDC007088 TaxID=3364773 RepID=UPI00369149BF